MNKSDSKSYSQILKSSTISGGAQATKMVSGMVRTKLVALLLGPTGVGLVGLYESIITLMATFSGLGVSSSAIRQVAEANGTGDAIRLAQSVRALRRVCWGIGLLGFVLTVVLAKWLGSWTFGNTDRSFEISVLGVAVLLAAISDGQSALVRGVRRIGDLARMQVWGSLSSLLISVGLYAWIGERGIIPVFLISALVNLSFSWWFAQRVTVPAVEITWRETFSETSRLVRLGLAFLVSSACTIAVGWGTRAWIMRDFGLHGNGIYQSAWSISGMFAGFILSAMGMDFYPRLTAVSKDNSEVNRLVNEQTEVGIFLALPGLLATMIFSPWVIRLLYSAAFNEAAVLLPWFVLGVFGRVVSWPLGFIQMAKGAARWFAVTQLLMNAVHLLLIWLGLHWFGLPGVAIAFALLNFFHMVGTFWVAKRLSGFRWTRPVRNLMIESTLLTGAAFLLACYGSVAIAVPAGGVLVIATGAVCLRRICQRLGHRHRVSLLAGRIPWIGSWFRYSEV